MIRSTKPKNARAKRALDQKAPKIVENVKSALFIPGNSSNKFLHDAMVDLSAFKKPYIKRFTKKNDILPFEDASKLEFLSEKNDCSLIVLSSHNKKRPNTLTFARTFNYKLYDMVELSILNNYKLLSDFKKVTFQVGLKPMMVFNGPIFDTQPVYKQLKSLFIDFFRGEVTNLQDVKGLQYILSFSAIEEDDNDNTSISKLPILQFRVYKLKSLKSSEPKLPRIELEEIGPRFDFKVGRHQSAAPEMEKEAFKIPRQLQPKEKKNVKVDSMGDQIATVHVGVQDLSKLQTRKMKGLKARYDQHQDDDEEVDEISYDEEEGVEEEAEDIELFDDDEEEQEEKPLKKRKI